MQDGKVGKNDALTWNVAPMLSTISCTGLLAIKLAARNVLPVEHAHCASLHRSISSGA